MLAPALIESSKGSDNCFYCGHAAADAYDPPAAFTGWSEIACPQSRSICGGCTWMLDQKRIVAGKDKPQKTQNYSWLIESDKQTLYSKAHKSEITDVLLSPPHAPWAFAIAESGQKHLIFRTPVNHDNDETLAVQLEMETVFYRPKQLRDRINLAKSVVAAIGHKGAAAPTVTLAICANGDLAQQWMEVFNEPLTRLALYVCPSKEICENEIAGT